MVVNGSHHILSASKHSSENSKKRNDIAAMSLTLKCPRHCSVLDTMTSFEALGLRSLQSCNTYHVVVSMKLLHPRCFSKILYMNYIWWWWNICSTKAFMMLRYPMQCPLLPTQTPTMLSKTAANTQQFSLELEPMFCKLSKQISNVLIADYENESETKH